MKYAVDRIENGIAVCEELHTKEIKYYKIEELPQGIKDGSIIIWKENKFVLDEDYEQKRKLALRAKMDKLKRKNLW